MSVIKTRSTIGKEELAQLNLGEQEIRVYLSNEYEDEPGQAANFHLRRKGVFLFDKETGERIR